MRVAAISHQRIKYKHMNHKKLLPAILAAFCLPAWADTPPPEPRTEPELRLRTAQPQRSDAQQSALVEEAQAQSRVVQVNAETLLANPELLSRAMVSALAAQNIAGIKVLLPIYTQWPQHDAGLAKFARATVAQAEGRSGEAVKLYRELIAAEPDSSAVRMRLAQALFEDQQNEAAADQFDRLQSEPLPEAAREMVAQYRDALRKRDSWQFYAGINVSREQNINQAPKQQRLGAYLSEAQCEAVRAQPGGADDDCWRGWTFDAPIDALGINYQAGVEKKWSLNGGWYAKASADGYGKYYPDYGRYNDTSMRISAGAGYADQRTDTGLMPFHERRIYGNDAYSYTNGARFYWNRWHTPRLQSLTALEIGRLKNMQRARSDIDSRLASGSLVFYTNARQYWLWGLDFYQERNGHAQSDNFNRYGGRAAWGQEWPKGISTRVQAGLAQRHYQTASFFSDGEKRRDTEWNTSLSLWHRALHFGGITPRLTVAYYRNNSNDAFYEYDKLRTFIEFNKTF